MNLENYSATLSTCQKYDAQLVAVSKTRSIQDITAMYDKGQRIFGENRVQEMVEKQALLPSDIQWHQIGHLQTNKVKYIAPFVKMIHSVDSEKVLVEINKQAEKHDRIINCLLQFHIAEEDSKYGFTEEYVESVLLDNFHNSLKNINLCGVMGMTTFSKNKEQVRKEFQHLKSIFTNLKKTHFAEKEDFKHISMGMSGDFDIALEEGSTMVRVGSLIFNS